jgi:AraC-like DNA-binding protein
VLEADIPQQSVTRVLSIDTRRLASGARFEAYRRWMQRCGLAAEAARGGPTEAADHIAVARELSGNRNVIGLADMEDPAVLQFLPRAADAAPALRIIACGGQISHVVDGQRSEPVAGGALVTEDVAEQRVHLNERTWRATILVRRADLHLPDSDIECALENGLRWCAWHTELMIRSCRAALLVQLDGSAGFDRTGADLFVAGVAELLLRSALEQPRGMPPSTARRRQLAERFIADHLTDPALSPEAVAADQNVSLRQLSRAFAEGRGIAATIVQARLEHADRLLRDRRFGSMSVADIAHLCRFPSATHFSRAYKSRFRELPSDVRRLPVTDRIRSVS